ncbi:MAG: hypothetical protein M3R50_04575 [Bacteroidota bacterium]|nr:hypothetical protein [Bacteroidota bacterium]
MKFWNKLCAIVLFFAFFCPVVHAQSNKSLKFNYKTFLFKSILNTSDTASQYRATAFINKALPVSESLISESFSTACYGFFCRQELKIEKVTRIPFRFRLGSLQQCNYYEGKE